MPCPNKGENLMKKRLFFDLNIKNIFLVIVFAALNVGLFFLSKYLQLPFWLDTIGTMAAAVELGVAAGVLSAVGSSVAVWLIAGNSLFYSVAAIMTAVIVGLLMTKDKQKDKLFIVSVGLLSGLVSTVICIPINFAIENGSTGNVWGDALKDMLDLNVSSDWFNTFASEAFVDLPDRVVSLFAALFILKLIRTMLGGKRGKASKITASAAAIVMALCSVSVPSFSIEAEAAGFDLDYETVAYSGKDGLSNSSVNAVAQTNDGYLWVGTYAGLYMYDGIKFDEADIHESIRTVKELCVDSKGRLWIGSNDSGIVCYDPADGSSKLFNTANGLDSDSIRAICEGTDGSIYVGTALALSKISPDGSVKTYYEWKDVSHVQSLVSLNGGGVVGVTNGGVLFLEKNDTLISTEKCSTSGADFRVAEKVGEFLYVGTSTAYVEKFFVNGETLEKTGKFRLGVSEYCNRLRYDASRGGLFYCCENGLGFIDCPTDTVTDLTLSDYNGAISDVCVDEQGNVWFASSKQGLMKYSKTPFKNLFSNAMIPDKVVNAVLKDGDKLYVGTDSGLVLIDSKYNRTIVNDATKLLKEDRIRNIYKDSKGNIWISTYGQNGLVRIGADGKTECISSKYEELSGMKFRSVTELSDGRILIASNMGLTFLRDGKPELSLSDSDGLENRYILSMIEREDGSVLAASDGDGIYIIKNDKVAGHIGVEEGLESAVILRIVPCKGGYLYVSSNGLFYDEGGKVRRLKNFPYSNNYDILISDSGNCYITSSAGLFIVSEEKLIEDEEYSCTLLNENWGLNTTFTANSWNIMEKGYLCLCCTDGIRMISAENYAADRGEYQLHLKSIEADGKSLDQSDGKWVIPSETRRIVLNISVNNFSLSNPRIHYYLEGSKDDGITCYQSEITPLAFTNLAYGEYDLHVCVLDDLTGEVVKEEVIAIKKEAAMYEYWYFKLYLMFVIMQLMMYVVFVVLSFKRRNQRIADTFKKYVAPQVVEEITKNGAKDITLSSENRDVAVLFVDIRGFTTMSEKLPPEQVVEILNSYFELTTNAIFDNGGTLDKFIGDATMAVFNAPFDLDDYVYKALMTAVEIVNGGAELEKKFLETYDLSVGFGVGINCGNAVVGNIGCSIRMDYTAIGDTVNTAARLESNAQKGQILISQNVYDRVRDRVVVESIGELSLKGKSKDVPVYSLKELK